MKPAARYEIGTHIERLSERGSLHGLSPGDWLERFLRTRDEDAFAALIDTYGPMVLGVCRSLLQHSHDADDAFQATFLLLVRKAPHIRDRSRLGSWLHRVACRVSRRARRQRDTLRNRFVPSGEAQEPAIVLDPETQTATAESRRLLHEAIDSLPGAQRDALILCDLEGLSHSDAAAHLRWPLGTVKGRLTQARRKLHRRLVRQGVTLSAAGVAASLAASARASVTPALREATVRAAVGLVARQSLASLLPSSTAALVTGESTSMMIIIGKYAAMSIVSVALVAGGAMALRQDTKKPVAVALEAGGAPAATSASNVDDEAKKLHGELADLELELETLNAQLVPLKSSYFTLSNDLTLKRAQLADFELNADESKKLKDDIRAEEKRLADVRAKHRDLAGEAAVVLARLNALRATLNDNQPASPAAVLQRKDEGDEQQQPEGPPPRQTATMGEIKINTAPGTAGITEQDRGALRIERDNVELDYATTEARVSALRDDLRNAIGWMLGTERSVRTIEDEPFVFRKDRGFQVKEEDLPEIKRNLAEELEVARKHVASLREQYEKANRELQALQQKQAELTEKLAAPEAAPRTIRPGDKLQIGVVSARPGRPLEGERLVRPDGTISLGYYGDLHVAGLDRTQIKVKLIEHMRQYLSDEALGLVVADDQGRPRPVSPALSNSVMVDETPSFAEGEVKPGVDETPKSPLGKIPIGAGAMGGGFR